MYFIFYVTYLLYPNSFLNEQQAGLCIVNFYKSITTRMHIEQCFCGERVGVLVQGNVIPEGEKDAEEQSNLYYNVGEIIHIGVNQATYLATEEKLKSKDDLKCINLLNDNKKSTLTEEQQERLKRFIKSHIRNRGMLIYPNNPVYVNRMKNKLQENILDTLKPKSDICHNCCAKETFCLYHVMLRNLRYTNEIVVDITDNDMQSLFWLGAAHGSDIYAITVLHKKTDKEREITMGNKTKKSRNVFDVAGLWTAVFETKDTEGFYRQLALAQIGIERHSKLMGVKNEYYENSIKECLFTFDNEYKSQELEEIFNEKQNEENILLESYYRRRFWNPMLRYNRLRIYVKQKDNIDSSDSEPRMNIVKWDFDAVSALSHYLSKRTVIGEYLIKALSNEENDEEEAKRTNFICIGSFVQPLEKDLAQYIYEKLPQKDMPINNVNIIHCHKQCEISNVEDDLNTSYDIKCQRYMYKGFKSIKDEQNIIYTQHPFAKCVACKNRTADDSEIIKSEVDLEKTGCCLNKDGSHIEIAQLILFRENPDDSHEDSYFRMSMCGSSGPATFALSALFIDEDQKKDCFIIGDCNQDNSNISDCQNSEGNETKTYLLSQLQMVVRKKFMEIFLLKLQERLDTVILMAKCSENDKQYNRGQEIEGDQKKRYFGLVKYAVSYYLNTVLYRYFLPFLSERDINRIYNGMYMYIHSMKAARVSPFVLDYPPDGDKEYNTSVTDTSVKKVLELIPDVLIKVLRGFRGLEVFYKISVIQENNEDSDKDTRIVNKIEMIDEENLRMNCFFIDGDD